MIDRKKIDPFVLGYLECAVWAESDEIGSATIEDIHGGTLARMVLDCERFQEIYSADLAAYYIYNGRFDPSHAGHDFWLTRNRHGAGFWDRHGVPDDVGKRLTDAAHAFGPSSIYLGDDGKIYGSEG